MAESPTPVDPQHHRVAALARLVVLLALAVSALWSRDLAAALALVALACLWTVVTFAERRRGTSLDIVGPLEAAGVGLVSGAAVAHSPAILSAFVVPPLVSGLYRRLWGASTALSTELFAIVVTILAIGHGIDADQAYAVFTWGFAGLGAGFIGTFLNSALEVRPDPLAPYLHAQTLLRRLIDVTEGLDTGLDPVSLGGAILSDVRDELPATGLALYVPRGDALTMLVTQSLAPEAWAEWEEAAVEAWTVGAPVERGRLFAFPLRADGSGVVSAVVVTTLSERLDGHELDARERMRTLAGRLRDGAVQLDTALLFATFRDAATAEERRRLAREMHDGVAQDIASLGYLVDALASTATTPQQTERIAVLRERITAVVAEIRRSLVNLRTSVGASESLGGAISAIARNLSEVSGVPIHVTLDEQTGRLRPEVEAELFRIAQEAMNNAIKHAQASAIEVHCQVRAPSARITVSDNGRGMQAPRKGSHGLSIMRERALLINASLEMAPAPGGGVAVTVAIEDRNGPSAAEDGRTRVQT
jgi:signal transduction histidine kinase